MNEERKQAMVQKGKLTRSLNLLKKELRSAQTEEEKQGIRSKMAEFKEQRDRIVLPPDTSSPAPGSAPSTSSTQPGLEVSDSAADMIATASVDVLGAVISVLMKRNIELQLRPSTKMVLRNGIKAFCKKRIPADWENNSDWLLLTIAVVLLYADNKSQFAKKDKTLEEKVLPPTKITEAPEPEPRPVIDLPPIIFHNPTN